MIFEDIEVCCECRTHSFRRQHRFPIISVDSSHDEVIDDVSEENVEQDDGGEKAEDLHQSKRYHEGLSHLIEHRTDLIE